MNPSIGKSKSVSDDLEPARARAFRAALGREDRQFVRGSALPAFWHQLYFWEATPAGELGPDGHARSGDFIPDFGLGQRMWAGGKLQVAQHLRLGAVAERTSTIESVSEKPGRSGRLVFVTVRHDFRQEGKLALVEHRDLVYRNAGGLPAPRTSGLTPESRRVISFDPVLLFRYSALTFNAHRIHYDADYCRDVAGYPGLVVSSIPRITAGAPSRSVFTDPCLTSLLVDEAESCLKQLRAFEYRAVAPTYSGEKVEICRMEIEGGLKLWIQGADGDLRMSAVAEGSGQ